MNVYQNPMYLEDVSIVADLDLPWEKLQNKTIMISGATGSIGSFLIDVITKKNDSSALNCRVIALGRNENRAKERFTCCFGDDLFQFLKYDANEPLCFDDNIEVDYILHLASNTHPLQYATDPIGTIAANVIGLKNFLDYASEKNVERFLFASSNEVYGENRGDVETFDEEYCGYINSNTLRAGYPESKRCGEALCQAYIKQKRMDIVIPRITRTYGPTLLKTDTKSVSQFLFKGIKKENIVLKSSGEQYYSFLYVADTVSGLLTVLLKGENGEAYNIADDGSDIKLKDLARIISEYSGTKVVYEAPDVVESSGYSKVTKARLSSKKLQMTGWTAHYSIEEGIYRTLEILRSVDD